MGDRITWTTGVSADALIDLNVSFHTLLASLLVAAAHGYNVCMCVKGRRVSWKIKARNLIFVGIAEQIMSRCSISLRFDLSLDV